MPEDKYLPTLDDRKAIIKTQIEESKRIIFRSYLDIVEGKLTSNDQLVTSSEYNLRTLKKKIDVLTEELESL